MSLDEFLNKYNKSMSQYEIDEIEDRNIKNIKRKYWDMKYKAFKDEYNISDKDVGNNYNHIVQMEKEELENLYNSTYKQM